MTSHDREFAQKVASELDQGDPSVQSGEIITIIIELLMPILKKWLEGCGEDSEAAIRRAKTPRLQSILLNVKMRREVGRKDWKKLGGRKMSEALLKVTADEDNVALIQSVMEN